MKTIAIMNNKGGVGKTVTAINLADILDREYHKRVVLADCDGQMNLTRFFFPGFDPSDDGTVAEVLTGEYKPGWRENIMPVFEGGTEEARLALLPGSPALYDLDLLAIRDGLGDTYALKRFCEAAAEDGETDYFIFDCPPGYTLASVSALIAADEVVIPMLVDGFSFAGMMDMKEQLAGLQRYGPRIAGVLVTQWHNSEVVRQGERLVRDLGVPVFKTANRRTDKVPESTFDRQPIVRYSPGSAAAQDYRRWVREYLGEELGHEEGV